MAGFDLRRRAGVDHQLRYVGRGSIQAALFDLGAYPAAIRAPEGRVWGEVYEMNAPAAVLATLDQIEGYRQNDPARSLYTRGEASVSLDDGRTATAWVYFYNAPVDRARRIASGDYLEHVRTR